MNKNRFALGLKGKFLVVLLGIVAVSAAISCVIVIYYEGGAHRYSLTNKGVSLAGYVADLSAEALLNKDDIALDNVVNSINNDPEVAYALIYDNQAHLRTGYFSSINLDNKTVGRLLADLPQNASINEILTALRNDRDIMEAACPVVIVSERIGSVVVGLSEGRINEVIRQSLYYILAGHVVGSLIAVLLALLMQRIFINPVIILAGLMGGVSVNRDYSIRAKRTSADELGALADGFNSMLDQIQMRDAELEKHRHQLESLVMDRTGELAKLNERQQVILESAGEGIIELDVEGRHVFLNKAACVLLGCAREDLLGKLAHTVWHHTKMDGSSHLIADCRIREALTSGQQVFVDDEIFWRADKVGFYVEYVVSPIKEQGKVAGAVVVFRDISERKMSDWAVREARDAAEAANQAKSDFLAHMSHEIRTPMNSIIGFANLLKDTDLNDGQKKYIDAIRSGGEILLSLINDILDVSKIEAGKIELEAIDFDLEYLVEDLVRMIYPKLNEKSLDISFVSETGMARWFKGDPTRIRQIVLNLLNNAVKFTDKGIIEINVRKGVEGAENDGCERVIISVKDTGTGIPKDKQHLLFQAFSQAHSCTARKFGGTGLGLVIVRSLAQKMGGDVQLISDEGLGSEFVVTLVLVKGADHAPSGVMMIDRALLLGKTVAIIDSNKNSRQTVGVYCEQAGMQVVFSQDDPWMLFDQITSATPAPDIIIADIYTRGRLSSALAQELRRDEYFSETRMLAVIADPRPGTAKEALANGFDAYLQKPVMKRELIDVIRTMIGDKRAVKEIVTRHTAEEVSLKGIRVLVAEDNDANWELVSAYLDIYECVSERACDGSEAVGKIKEHSYDVCLMDIMMPVMGGLQAAEVIRNELHNNIPIIALSAAVMKEDKSRAFAAGVDDFLGKPIEPEMLKASVLKWGKRSAG